MEVKEGREFPLARILLAFIIANVLFFLVFLFVSSVSYINYESLKTNNVFINESLDIEDELKCNEDYFYQLSKLLDNSGVKVSLLEERLGVDYAPVKKIKKDYTYLLLKHLNLVEKYNRDCNGSFQVILFFYSNDKEIDDESAERTEIVSYILGTLKLEYKEKVMIYSFDSGIGRTEVNNMIKEYGFKDYPQVVLNGEVLPEFDNIKQIEKYLGYA